MISPPNFGSITPILHAWQLSVPYLKGSGCTLQEEKNISGSSSNAVVIFKRETFLCLYHSKNQTTKAIPAAPITIHPPTSGNEYASKFKSLLWPNNGGW